MSPVPNARVLYNKHPTTFPVPGQTAVYDASKEIDLDNVPLNGGFLLKTIVLSSDPYLRSRMRAPEIKSYMPALVLGQPVDNFGVGLILRSDDENYSAGTYLYGYYPFQEYYIGNAKDVYFPWLPLQKPKELSWSVYVGALGMPGQTAYFAWKALVEDKAKTSKTFFISVGGGPVGTFLIQFAKLNYPELKIIASAGTQAKLDFMQSIGADVVFNYKTADTEAVLAAHGPIDIYWDMAAGPILDAALVNMAEYGLIVACGAISGYNTEQRPPVKNFQEMFQRSLTVRGYRGTDFMAQYLVEFMTVVPPLVLQGKIKPHEHRYIGLDKAEYALADVHTGANFGKAVIIVSDDS